jgi:hypothetical protein
MSHVADIALSITDLDALEAAAEAAGYELVRDAKTYRWYGSFLNDWQDGSRAAALRGIDPKLFGTCEHKLRRKGAPDSEYEIGLTAVPGRKGLTPIYDSYGGQGRKIEEAFGGVGLPRLKQNYAAQLSARQMRRQGYRVQITEDAGRLRVRGTK